MPLAWLDPPGVRTLLTRPTDPLGGLSGAARGELLAAAGRHGLLGVLAGRIPRDDTAIARQFDRLAAGSRLQNARLRDGLEEVLGCLASAGLSVPVALKGPILADRLHPDPGLRAASDLDLLVPAAELDGAVAALLAIGFRRDAPMVEAFQRRQQHHVHLARAHGPDVELHFKPQSAFGARLPAAELLARALPYRTARATPVRILSPEDELIVLAVHAAGHLFARAGWLLDLLLFVERHPDLDWRVVEERAVAYRCRRALAWALSQLRELGAPIPSTPLLVLDPGRARLAARLAPMALADRGRRSGVFRVAIRVILGDRPWTAPGHLLQQAWWVIRRRVDRAAHLLNRRRRAAGGR